MAGKNKRPNPFANLKTGDILEIRGRVYWYDPPRGFDDTLSRFVIWLGEDTPERRKHSHLPTLTEGETWTAASWSFESKTMRLGSPSKEDGISAWVMLDSMPKFLFIHINDIQQLTSGDD